MHVLSLIGTVLAIIHFAIPLGYYVFMKIKYYYRPWNIRLDPNIRLKLSIIIPTYMAARTISSRLNNIYQQDYPKDLIEVIVVDDNSPDGTAKRVQEWIQEHPEFSVTLINRARRTGKFDAILNAVKNVLRRQTDVIIFTDDDCLWEPKALKNIIKYFADPRVGAVTGSINYYEKEGKSIYSAYRNYYNTLRIAESKAWSTPIHNGPLLAIRKDIIEKIGLPVFPGSDDSAFGSYVAFAGYRSIQVDDAWVYEPLRNNQYKRMVRRATHLITYFIKLKNYTKKYGVYTRTPFDKIWYMESYLHLVNPWLLAISMAFLIISALFDWVSRITLLLGIILLFYKTYRTWLINQLYLLSAIIIYPWENKSTWSR